MPESDYIKKNNKLKVMVMKNQGLKFVMYFFILFVNPIVAFAQAGGLPDSPEGDDDPLVDPAPIDDFIWILIFSALVLGACVLLKNIQKLRD
jgi:hypothetical protein